MKTREGAQLYQQAELAWWQAEALAATGVAVHAFSTRHGSPLELCEALGLGARPLVSVRQVHGDRLVVVDDGATCDWGGLEADGLLTASPAVALVVWTADCVPVLLVDPRRRAVAAVHSGWRGTALRISGKAVRRMVAEFGSNPGELLAAIGPCAGPCCYEVDEPVLDQLARAFPGVSERFWTPRGEGRALLNLRAAVLWDLKETGVPAENVTLVDQCTVCQPEWFFSYRRQGRGAGRLAAIIGLREGRVCPKENGFPEETEAGSGR